jgi:hypothetical protein
MQATHDHGEAARCARGRWRAQKIKQRSRTNCVVFEHGGFYLFTPRVFAMRIQLDARFM